MLPDIGEVKVPKCVSGTRYVPGTYVIGARTQCTTVSNTTAPTKTDNDRAASGQLKRERGLAMILSRLTKNYRSHVT